MDVRRIGVVASLATFAVVLAVALSQVGEDPSIRTVDVASSWDEIPMTCRTTKVVLGGDDVEWFRCRGVGGARPPAGHYVDQGTVWYSDVDGRPAVRHVIDISPSGVVTGWARYR